MRDLKLSIEMIESTDAKIIREFQLLPEHLQEQVLNFVLFLKWKHERQMNEEKKPKFEFGSGSVKGTIAPDFDEPLEDFKDNM